MRKFTTIFVTVVLCLATLAVCASAASNTNCAKNVHDWSAWAAIEILEDGSIVMGRSCICGAEDEPYIIPATHEHTIAYVPAAAPCHVAGCAEYWYCTDCEMVFADEALTKETTIEALEIAPICELGYVPAAEPCHAAGSAEYWVCPECNVVFADEAGTITTNRKNLEIAPDTTLEHFEAVPACHGDGMAEYWYCSDCKCFFTDAEGKYNIAYLSLVVPGDLTKLQHVEAVPATCHENGMQEYWYCADCDCYFTDAEGKYNVARLSLVVPAQTALQHVEAVPATCHENGMQEYWYCSACDCYFTDAEGKFNIARLSLVVPAQTALVHVEATAPCHANGMQEYWYCPACDCYFTDAEGKYNIASLSLVVPGDLSKLEYHAAVAPTATENGMQEYWYCAGCNCFFTDAEGKFNIAYLSLTVPATGETPVAPDTGDNAIFFIVALVAVATLGVAAVSFKKREN